ncbi:MAG: YlbF family regulator [Syntrophomonadaceae bacterium]
MTTDDIIKMAFELGNAVAASDEIENLKRMQTTVTQDKDAYELIMKYQDARNRADNGDNSGLITGKTAEDHLNILEQQLNNNVLIKELMEAQEKFDNLMQAIYFAMNQAISGGAGGCSSGGCDSCSSGCCS